MFAVVELSFGSAERSEQIHRKSIADSRNSSIPTSRFRSRFWATRESYVNVLKSKFGTEYLDNVINTDVKMHYSKTALARLELTTLMGVIHRKKAMGRYIIIRVLSGLETDGANWRVLVEDHHGHLAYFKLTSFVYRSQDKHFPPGMVMVVKEPVLVFTTEGVCLLICYSPTDVLRVRENTGLAETVGLKDIRWKTDLYLESTRKGSVPDWTNKGNDELLLRKNASKALDYHLVALNLTKDDEQLKWLVHMNLVSVYNTLGYHEAAIEYADKVSRNVNTILVAGHSYYDLRNFREASSRFRQLLALDPNHRYGLSWFPKCIERLKEEKRMTENDIARIKAKSESAPNTSIDCADFIGPIRMKMDGLAAKGMAKDEFAGKGFVTTEDVTPGTVLMVCKATCVSFSSVLETDEEDDYKKAKGLCIDYIATELALLMLKNPTMVGTRIRSQILKHFGPGNVHQYCEGDEKEPIIDVEQLIRFANSESCRLLTHNVSFAYFEGQRLFRDSCIFNTKWETYNDVMVIRALKPIKLGEEVFLDNTYGLDCHEYASCPTHCGCDVCAADCLESEELRKRRETLSREFHDMTTAQEFSGLEALVERLEETYSASGRLKHRLHLSHPYLELSKHCHREKGFGEGIATADKALSTLGLDRYTLQRCVQEAPAAPVFPDHVYVTPFVLAIVDVYLSIYTLSGQVGKIAMWKKIRQSVVSLFKVCD